MVHVYAQPLAQPIAPPQHLQPAGLGGGAAPQPQGGGHPAARKGLAKPVTNLNPSENELDKSVKQQGIVPDCPPSKQYPPSGAGKSHEAEAQEVENRNAKKFIAHLMHIWKNIFQHVF